MHHETATRQRLKAKLRAELLLPQPQERARLARLGVGCHRALEPLTPARSRHPSSVKPRRTLPAAERQRLPGPTCHVSVRDRVRSYRSVGVLSLTSAKCWDAIAPGSA
jgi:hypothetical protein